MAKLLGKALLVLAVYSVIFLFADNSMDATRKATFKDIAPAIFMQGADMDSIVSKAKSMNIDVNMGIYKALQKNPDVSDIDVQEYGGQIDRNSGNVASFPPGMAGDLVRLTFSVGKKYDVQVLFLAQKKRYFHNFTQFAGPIDIKISREGKTRDIEVPDDVQHLFGAIFLENKTILLPMVGRAYGA